ncbi:MULTISPECIES: MoaD/ThiS family protein [Streptomyces]|uniref:MoaD/ThiS family protein n=1 Tax=Streptomyces yunnanensis TaxID=156453 RepID=A0ABY8AH05_9ACTN|nr:MULTISPECIES: MoaD/ThiS family protein [Streptomyces]AJC60460.1 hypothetical protein GZL_07912 [Streptomyces sp. 769]WEB44300.1 MoaD/ThiS family protein [Streptomyces yunnanensis]
MKIHVSGILRKYVDYRKDLAYDAPTVRAGLEQLCSEYPQLATILFEGNGDISAVHRLFLNGDQLASDTLDAPTTANDTIDIITAIAGGSRR